MGFAVLVAAVGALGDHDKSSLDTLDTANASGATLDTTNASGVFVSRAPPTLASHVLDDETAVLHPESEVLNRATEPLAYLDGRRLQKSSSTFVANSSTTSQESWNYTNTPSPKLVKRVGISNTNGSPFDMFITLIFGGDEESGSRHFQNTNGQRMRRHFSNVFNTIIVVACEHAPCCLHTARCAGQRHEAASNAVGLARALCCQDVCAPTMLPMRPHTTPCAR
jgi:hypothetical protein